MPSTSTRVVRISCGLTVVAVLVSQTALADKGIRTETAAPLANAQLAAFADLVEQPRDEVAQLLQLEPSMIPLAVTAAEARMQRKRSGKIRAAVGFSLLGAAGIASALLWRSAFTRAGGGYDVDTTRALGAYVAGACAAVGLGVGISGIVVIARQSQIESEAVARYQRTPYDAALPVRLGHAFRLPLLAISF